MSNPIYYPSALASGLILAILATLASSAIAQAGNGGPVSRPQSPPSSDAPTGHDKTQRNSQSPRKPNVLFIMTDQQRFDTIRALGNPLIYTPNLDRLARCGVVFTNAYSTCPVCVPARYTIRTGCEPPTTRTFFNGFAPPVAGQEAAMTARCGPYLAQTMKDLGYRTFGIGKFHTQPVEETLGYEVHLHSEELYGTPAERRRDAYASWIAQAHPAFDFIEGLMGERTEMYYMPQMRPMPAAITVERWATDRAVEQIRAADPRPYFALVSFVTPHPPFAPPIPFNRMYDPDRMPNPVCGDTKTDHMDEQIPWMNHLIWADDINESQARVLKARYYGAISFVDQCLGRILDAVESRHDAANTVICFFADHGDLLGDHHGWQKESFFEAACRVPFLVSWPAQLPERQQRGELVCLTDLFGIATARPASRNRAKGSTCSPCSPASRALAITLSATTASRGRGCLRSWCGAARGSTFSWPMAAGSSCSMWRWTRTS